MNQLYLYVALAGVAIVLFALTRAKSASSAGSSVVATPTGISTAVDQEMKDTFDEFMNEIERENNRIHDTFAVLQRETREKLAGQQDVVHALELRVQELQQQVVELRHRPIPAVAEAVLESAEPKAPGFLLNEKYIKVVELSDGGLTPPQIARETGIGIGEIQLVLGLVKREEAR
ncbi:hypothetical protein [Tumebacillus permanentifrigoris]|uniref:Uncharacterized protein n=1 Tax=Tumebacillus permanentifrigoris TaxID=378543 RepID=A0A316D7H5_9BACL|nr:hypothetical protein [Tumebacillus permanentifrigoris]PWK12683.1 hypothetical protein C7459_10935 [Tumebacillus permanentifrigoris]